MKIVVLILAIAASAGLFFSYVKPSLKDVRSLKSEIGEIDSALAQAREIQAVRDMLLTKYNSLDPNNLAKLKKILPDHIDNVRLIIDIDEIAARYGLKVSNINISNLSSASGINGLNANRSEFANKVSTARPGTAFIARSPASEFGAVDLSFSVDTSYDLFLAFLKDMERSLRIVDITSIEFSAGDENKYTFDVHIRTYWMP